MLRLRFGGFPECLNPPSKTERLNSLFQTIYLSDIAARNKISNLLSLRVIIKKAAESIGEPLSYSRLTNIIRASGAALAKSTCIQYLQAAYESCLLIPIQNIVGKLADRESTPKIYFADTGLSELLKFDALADQLENAVALQLLRLYGVSDEVFFYRRGAEVDFYVPQEGLAVQACVKLGDSPETVDREVGAFRELAKELPVRRRIIVTLDESHRIETSEGEVGVTPAWRWLLESEEARRNRPAGGEPSA